MTSPHVAKGPQRQLRGPAWSWSCCYLVLGRPGPSRLGNPAINLSFGHGLYHTDGDIRDSLWHQVCNIIFISCVMDFLYDIEYVLVGLSD